MKATIKKVLNVYVVTGIIGGLSLLYMVSFAFVLSDVNKGSSVAIQKALMEKQKKQSQ